MLNYQGPTKSKVDLTTRIEMCVITVMLIGMAIWGLYSFNKERVAAIKESESISYTEINKEAEQEQQRQAEFQMSEDQKEYKEMQASLTDSYSFIYLVHEMANTKIEAVDGKIRGTMTITLPRVKATLEFMRNNGEYLKTALGDENYSIVYKGISEWQMKNYSSAAQVHNIVWEKLGGGEGKAK